MTSNKKLEILNKILGGYKQNGAEYLFSCPFCKTSKKKLSVNIDKNVYKCWICNESARNLQKLIFKFGSQEERILWPKSQEFLLEEQEEHVEVPSLPDEFVSLVENYSETSIPFRNYLINKRGLTEKDISFWKIGYCVRGEYADCIIIPSIGQRGAVNYFVARHIYGNLKYKNPIYPKEKIIFNELMIDFDQDVILTEGVFDAIKAGENSIPVLGSSLSENSSLFRKLASSGTSIYFAFDPDASTKQASLIQKFLEFDIDCHEIDIRPYKDAGEMTKKQFSERKASARQITQSDFFEFFMERQFV